MPHRIATASRRRPRTVLAAWIVATVLGFLAAPVLFGGLTSEAGSIKGSEAGRAQRLLDRSSPTGEQIYAVADGRAADDPGLRTSVTAVAAALRATSGVRMVETPYPAAGIDSSAAGIDSSAAGIDSSAAGIDTSAVATDGRAVAIAVQFAPTAAGDAAVHPAAQLLRTIDAPRVIVGGGPLQDDEMDNQAAADLARAELISMPILLLVLLVIFGGFVAAGLPIAIAFFGVATTMLALTVVSAITDVSVYAVNIITMLGIGLAVDYALLIVSRLREERRVHAYLADALDATFATAGRTVAFSGVTVAASLAGLLVFPDPFLRSMGAAGLAVVLLDMLAALTLLPALLGLVGHRVRPGAAPRPDGGWLGRLVRTVRRRALAAAVVVTALLVLAGAPFLTARWADADARSLPASAPSRQLVELAQQRFARPADTSPITLVARGSATAADSRAYLSQLRGLDGVVAVTARKVPGLTVLDVRPTGAAQGDVARRLVHQIRELRAPLDVQVTGDAADLVDYEAAIMARLPFAAGIVVLATLVLLFAFTGSVVVAMKAILLNLLSLAAAFGALVWVFQDGHLGWLVGTEALGSLSITTPVLVFAIAFGVSMDYEVFLLGRITEAWRRTGDNDAAVAEGIVRTVTAAALLMAIVFAGFVAGGFSPVKQVGLGLMLAVLVDATLVRMVLLPATMTLLGRANWWAPAPLRRLHRRIALSESAPASVPASAAVTVAVAVAVAVSDYRPAC